MSDQAPQQEATTTPKDDATDKDQGSGQQQQQQQKSNPDDYWRRKAESAQKEVDKLKKAQMSDLERAQAERDEARRERDEAASKLKQTSIQSKFATAAAKAGCLDADDAYKLADLSTIGENGEGIDKAVKALQESKPWLFGKQESRKSLGSGGTGNGNGSSNPNQKINDEIRRFARGY